MSLVSDTIRQFLLLDVTDTTPANVMSLNPGMFAAEGEVPLYLYTSLSTMLTGASGNSSELGRRIVARAGEHKTVFDGYIGIRPAYADSTMAPFQAIRPDHAGAESAMVEIFFTQGKNSMDFGALYNWELRVRMLLDHSIRSTILQKSPNLPINAGSTSIDNDVMGVYCKWVKVSPTPNQIEISSCFRADYIRAFGRTVVPG